jgi:hypothetical protein
MSKKAKAYASFDQTVIVTSWKATPATPAAYGAAMFKAYVSDLDKVENTARGNMLSFLKPRPSNEDIELCIAAINAQWTTYRETKLAEALEGIEDEKQREEIAESVSKWLRGGRAKRKSELVGVLDGAKVVMTYCITCLESMPYHKAVAAINVKRRENGQGQDHGKPNTVTSTTLEQSPETQAAMAAAHQTLRKSDDALATVVSQADDNAVFNAVVSGIDKLKASGSQSHRELGEMLAETFEAWKASVNLSKAQANKENRKAG